MNARYDLELRAIAKRYGEFSAVAGVSFAIPKGAFFSILGPSGCGKTTLLRMIAGFIEPDAGEILIAGSSVLGLPPNRRPVNIVFQNLALFPMMSVAENIGYGLRRRGMAREEIARKVEAMLARVGLPGMGAKRVQQLSGGQQQRVAIARCLVLDPTVLLLDEPLGALDLKLREQMKVELKLLQHQIGTTFVYITHDQSEALVMSDRVAVMNRGRFEQVASPAELYRKPATAFVAGFVGEANRWQGRVVEAHDGALKIEIDGAAIFSGAAAVDGLSVGAQVDVFVRPESIAVGRSLADVAGPGGESANVVSGRIEGLLFNGANSRLLVATGKGASRITAALPQSGPFVDLSEGENVAMAWPAQSTLCFPAAPS
ncbi:MAG TPA: ABC transporter ATP-binding protein [Alphaproteobacteria bacterium]|nr:ABC transporter ATP-binding protein [Alphaproteobacteria bacterium]